ncbi:conserved phage protein [Lysinibacillus capsici]|uniref:Conserved phage protein n=1 Tax=Lysinibacillus capsici TaxID=2115968 RepID=A0A2X0XMG9_9BACI|nr:helix-turn-helix domain-containing protein [Lysinibacillus capsici]MED4553920.1 helix-turn-helix domain-containing protein [Lysinibacillus capsici]SPT98753.1 conserved phage protein [Lysinibacillus capsici]
MDTAVEEHIAAHYYDLTESERAIVFKLASHSLEHPGACHLKAATIAAALEISIKTVYRAISKLESLGIVKKETTVKSKGGQGAASTLFALQCPSVEMLKSLVRVRLKRNNLKTNHLNLLSSKQANNIMSLGK